MYGGQQNGKPNHLDLEQKFTMNSKWLIYFTTYKSTQSFRNRSINSAFFQNNQTDTFK